MKRSRSTTPEEADQTANGSTTRKRQITVAEDDDPYGLNVGAPGFLCKPGGNKGGFVPGYLRVPGSAMTAGPQINSMATTSQAFTKRGSQTGASLPAEPSQSLQPIAAQPAVYAVPAVTQPAVPAVATPAQPGPQSAASAMPSATLQSKAQTQPALPAKTPLPSLPSPVWSPGPNQGGFLSTYIPTDNQGYNVDRKRLQSKDLPEQHRLPDDLPDTQAKSATSASGPLSAEIPVLPAFHEEILKFVEQAAPNQTEQLTKVPLLIPAFTSSS